MQSHSHLRIALLGAGRHAQHHAQAIVRCPNVELVAVADPFESALAAMRAISPSIRTFKSPEEMLASELPDVVHVVTPPSSHKALALQALRAGCHIYVEKPFAERVEDAEEILGEAAARRRLACAGHQLLYEPPTRVLGDYLPSVGRLNHVESYFSFQPIRHSIAGQNVLRSDYQLLDVLPHPVYLLLHVLEKAGQGRTELASLQLGCGGTVHALIRRGEVTGTLIVTLEGRPVESFLRIVGTNGTLVADYVRSTTQRNIGPGNSGIDKLLAPYRQALQLVTGTTISMANRCLKRQRSYPGLTEIFSAFYNAVASNTASPLSPQSLIETVRICEKVAELLQAAEVKALAVAPSKPSEDGGVLVTGGTGFLGKEIVAALLDRKHQVRVVARREPAPWERIPGVEYVVADISREARPDLFKGIDTVIHAAAETAGGWEEHQHNSLDATENMIRGAAASDIARFLHISSLSVLAPGLGKPVGDDHPMELNPRGSGPYVWGKVESERLAVKLGNELGVSVRVVRPGAFVDYRDFDPPGLLGKRVGSIFVAVGPASDRLGVMDVGLAGRVIAWMLDNWDEIPTPLNLLDPVLPTKQQLVDRMRKSNPDLTVVWLPRFVLLPLSWVALIAQKLLRPRRPAINVAKVFRVWSYDTAGIARIVAQMQQP